jgi:DNA-binding transcriptional regulator YhcF (GntR family)
MAAGTMEDVPPKPAVPPSVAVETALRAMLAGMESGDQLPSVGTLAADLGASRRTVSKVLAKLAGEHLVTVWPSYGTFKV